MKGHLVCFLLLVVTFATATERDDDNIDLHVKGQVEQQTPEPPTDDPSGTKQQGKPAPPTYGQCPPTTTLLHPQMIYCQENGPCPGDEKCCQIGNIRKCVLPKGVHNGYCPRPHDQAVYKKPCAGDYQCGWHEKCCRTDGQKKCVTAVPAVPGHCPKRRLPPVPTTCGPECKEDYRCHSGKKCCFHDCGLKCVDPERHQEQDQDQDQEQEQEQDQKKGKDGGDAGKGKCRTNQDCPPRKRCCEGVCRQECQPQGICHLPKETGPCRGNMPRWFHNRLTGKCELFIYGGCQGNANNFETQKQCELRCVLPGICHLPKETGPCMAYMPRWFHNRLTGKCELFIYGGCQGNANNFETQKQCELRCVLPDLNKPGTCPIEISAEAVPCGKFCTNDATCPSVQRCCETPCGGKECKIPQEYLPGYCPVLLLPPSKGEVCFRNCTNDLDCTSLNLPRKKCCTFADRKICVDGVEEHPGVCPRRVEVQPLIPCNNTCSEDHECPLTEKCCFTGCSRGCLPSVRSDKCQLPPPEDSCKQTLLRYHYDPDKKKCVSYQSCGDNRNNFKTKELCEKACGKISKEVCKLPKDPGLCQGYLQQYYFNWKTKKCEIFVYGLCGGNENRFSTKVECQMVCGEFEQQQQQQPRD